MRVRRPRSRRYGRVGGAEPVCYAHRSSRMRRRALPAGPDEFRRTLPPHVEQRYDSGRIAGSLREEWMGNGRPH